MDVSPNALRKETVQVLNQVEAQMREVRDTAGLIGVSVEKVRDGNGNWAMIPLLLAKSQCLSTLTQLNEQGRRR